MHQPLTRTWNRYKNKRIRIPTELADHFDGTGQQWIEIDATYQRGDKQDPQVDPAIIKMYTVAPGGRRSPFGQPIEVPLYDAGASSEVFRFFNAQVVPNLTPQGYEPLDL